MTDESYRILKKVDLAGQLAAAVLGCLLMVAINRGGGIKLGFVAIYLTVGMWQVVSALACLAEQPKHHRSDARRLYHILLLSFFAVVVASISDVSAMLTVIMIGSAFLAVYYFALTAWEIGRRPSLPPPAGDSMPEQPQP